MKKTFLFINAVSIFLFSCQKRIDTEATLQVETNNSQPLEISNVDNGTPNIIFILADDMAWNVFGNYPGMNGTKANTPTLDSLAKEGVTFLNYWTHPVCSPSRAALLTGEYGFRTGVGSNNEGNLSDNDTIIQRYITEKTFGNYTTAVIGKWDVSPKEDLWAPERMGAGYAAVTQEKDDYYNWHQTISGVTSNITTYITTHQVNQSVDWIKKQSNPFFLWLTFTAPHSPFHRPPLELISNQNLVNNQSIIDANPLRYYRAAIKAMDTEIARLLASLSTQQRSNTIIIFTADNGTPPEISIAPYDETRSKATLFQGGINTPLIVCGKGVTRKNVIENNLVQAQDVFATIADVAGVSPNGIYKDGISFKPYFTSNVSTGKRNVAFIEFFGDNKKNLDHFGYAIRNDTFKLIELDNGRKYFFNLINDRFENNDLFRNPLSERARDNLKKLRDIKNGIK